jgi:holo-[acyl-carrier protein] synthase
MLGIDIIKTSRMRSLMERFDKKALQRFLCEEEIKSIKNYKSAAGYWAAKEACSKALGTGIGKKCSFKDIRIYKDELGAPKIALSHKIITEFNIINAALSITHDGEYAIAVVTLHSSSTTDKIKEF